MTEEQNQRFPDALRRPGPARHGACCRQAWEQGFTAKLLRHDAPLLEPTCGILRLRTSALPPHAGSGREHSSCQQQPVCSAGADSTWDGARACHA
ncbi:hypothetical protein NDU88_007462 [Pleurodeles waltl]|uniref:Uncharacterized protein n=1 Tax=Pleurodeles waltl TaxID=8319 RepID=A0AAV7VTL9_PLEWA|nr:hypothetical protein NDU88_007462 [Pleurodeles waltl]